MKIKYKSPFLFWEFYGFMGILRCRWEKATLSPKKLCLEAKRSFLLGVTDKIYSGRKNHLLIMIRPQVVLGVEI